MTVRLGAQLSIATFGDSATVRGGTGSPDTGGMVDDRLGEQVVEAAVVAALGGGVVDFEQGFRFRPAHRLMLDRGGGQDARAPGGIVGVQRAGKVNAAFGGGTFPGDHAIADHREGKGCGVTAGNLRGIDDADGFGKPERRGRHRHCSFLSFLFWASMFMRA